MYSSWNFPSRQGRGEWLQGLEGSLNYPVLLPYAHSNLSMWHGRKGLDVAAWAPRHCHTPNRRCSDLVISQFNTNVTTFHPSDLAYCMSCPIALIREHVITTTAFRRKPPSLWVVQQQICPYLSIKFTSNYPEAISLNHKNPIHLAPCRSADTVSGCIHSIVLRFGSPHLSPVGSEAQVCEMPRLPIMLVTHEGYWPLPPTLPSHLILPLIAITHTSTHQGTYIRTPLLSYP